MFYLYNDIRVMVKDAARYVLVADAAAVPDDGREAILFTPEMSIVGNNLMNGLRSYDVQDTDSSARKLLEELDKSGYLYGPMTTELLPQPDGSWLVCGTGPIPDKWEMNYHGPAVLDTIALTDTAGSSGTVAVSCRNMPAGSYRSAKAYTVADYTASYTPFSYGSPYLYTQESGGCFAVKFNTNGLPRSQSLTLKLTNINGVYGDYATVTPEAREKDVYMDETAPYLLALFRFDEVPADMYYIGVEGYLPNRAEPVFTASFRPSGEPARATVTPTAAPAPTPSATPAGSSPAPSAAPTLTPPPVNELPPDGTPYTSQLLEVENKPRKYSHYSAHLRQYAGCTAARVYFRWHDPLPEGAYMRIVAVNDEPGDYGMAVIGPADLSSAPADMLGATFVADAIPMDQIARLTLECVDPATDEVIFTYGLVNRSARPLPYRTTAPNYGSGSGYDVTDSLGGLPAPTPYSPTYNYNNNNYGWNYGSGTSWIEDGMQIGPNNPNNVNGWGGFGCDW